MKNPDSVFFYCDECKLLDPVLEKFYSLYPDKRAHTFSDIVEITEHLKTHHPGHILFYLTKPDKNVMSAIKYLRENEETTSIPIIIFQNLPTELDLRNLYNSVI